MKFGGLSLDYLLYNYIIITMKNEQRTITTIFIAKSSMRRMEIIARELGYYQTRGVGAGRSGSLSKLIEAIAIGEVNVDKINPSQDTPSTEPSTQSSGSRRKTYDNKSARTSN